MMLVLPVVELPRMVIPLLVGKSDERCSRISRKSHFRPTNIRGADTGGFGISKNNGLRNEDSLIPTMEASMEVAGKDEKFKFIIRGHSNNT
jgi:hypothetical protein